MRTLTSNPDVPTTQGAGGYALGSKPIYNGSFTKAPQFVPNSEIDDPDWPGSYLRTETDGLIVASKVEDMQTPNTVVLVHQVNIVTLSRTWPVC